MSAVAPDLLRAVIEPLCTAKGLDLEDLDVALMGRRRRVKVVVDADGGVDLDQCADLSREVSAALDESDVMGESPYTLEVSSPGVSRPLTQPRHWRRNVGRLVRVRPADGDDVTGRIVRAADDHAVVEVGAEHRELSYDRIATAKVQAEFRRASEEGQ